MTTREQGLDMEALEAMVDRHGLEGVLSMLSEICGEKAEHVAANWQDDKLAADWQSRVELLDAVHAKVLGA